MAFRVDAATEADVPTLLSFIRQLAEYEKLRHTVASTPADFQEALFGERRPRADYARTLDRSTA